jgi:membrane protease YdiL (CAAX protease family)
MQVFRDKTLIWFFGLAFALAWICWAPLVVSGAGLGIAHFDAPFELLLVGTFAPSVAALIVGWKSGRRHFEMRAFTSWKRMLLWSIAGPALLIFGMAVVPALIVAKDSFRALNWGVFLRPWVFFSVANLMGGPLGEELGWRGLALPRLQVKFGPVRASILLGCIWAAWHLPLFSIKDWGPAGTPAWYFVAFITMFTFLMTFVFNGSGSSVIAAIVLHYAFNQGIAVFAGLLGPAVRRPNLPPEAVIPACMLLLVALVLLFTRGRLSFERPISSSSEEW